MSDSQKSVKDILDNLAKPKIVARDSKVKVINIDSLVEAVREIIEEKEKSGNNTKELQELLLRKQKEIEKKKLDSEKAWQKQLADKEQSIIQLETKCQTLQEIIEAKDTTIKTLTASEVILQNEVQALKNRDLNIRKSKEYFEQEQETLQKQIKNLNEKLEQAELDIDKWQRKYRAIQSYFSEQEQLNEQKKAEWEQKQLEFEKEIREKQKELQQFQQTIQREREKQKEILEKKNQNSQLIPQEIENDLRYLRKLSLWYRNILNDTCDYILSTLGGDRKALNDREKKIQSEILEIQRKLTDLKKKKLPKFLWGIDQLLDVFCLIAKLEEIREKLVNLITKENLTRNYGPIQFSL